MALDAACTTPHATLAQSKEDGLPVFRFGSLEIAALHDEALEPAVQVGTRGEGWRLVGGSWWAARTDPIYGRKYGSRRDGFQYVVDHGEFHTLNTLRCGQSVPEMVDLAS